MGKCDWRLWLEIGIEIQYILWDWDFEFGLGIRLGIESYDWKIRIEIGDKILVSDWELELDILLGIGMGIDIAISIHLEKYILIWLIGIDWLCISWISMNILPTVIVTAQQQPQPQQQNNHNCSWVETK